MSMQKPLEGLLRAPFEWLSSLMCLTFALLYCSHSEMFVVSESVGDLIAILLSLFSIVRFLQGLKVVRYQSHLKQMPKFALETSKLPCSNAKLYLGKGFEWKTVHTQRLRDLDLDYNQNFKYPSKIYYWIKNNEEKFLRTKAFSWISRLTSKDHCLNPFRPYPEVGGDPCLHGVGFEESDVMIALKDRASHMLILGQPGVGKTRLAEILITQDIKRGDVVIVLDPKGDADLLKRIYIEARRSGREKEFKIFHLGFPEFSAKYNGIGNFTRITEVANRIANQLPKSGDSAAFAEFGWQFVNSIAVALVSLGEKPSYKKIKYYLSNMDVLLERYLDNWLSELQEPYIEWIDKYIADHLSEKRTINRLKALVEYVLQHNLREDTLFDDLYQANRYDRDYFSKITASLMPLLKKLTTGDVSELLSPNYKNIEDKRSILDWYQVIRSGGIVYVGLDALTDNVVASAVGNAMFSDLVSVAGRIYKYGLEDGFPKLINQESELPAIRIHADEFNEIIGDEFIPLLNKGRGAGVNVTAYTQTWSDVEARLQMPAKAEQVAGNFGIVIMFRCNAKDTVNMLLKQIRKVPIWRVIPASASNDTPYGENSVFFQSVNEDRFGYLETELIQQTDILNMPKGQAFCLLEGGKLFKIRLPLPKMDEANLPHDIETLLGEMRKKNEENGAKHVNVN